MRFKDVFSIIGPAMIGPSSSHTAGAVRLGLAARHLLGGRPERATIVFFGSFAETFAGHGTDLAVTAGILGYRPDDSRIRSALAKARCAGLDISFRTGKGVNPHPNTLTIHLQAEGRHHAMTGCSIGGGAVEVVRVDGFDVRFSCHYPTLVLYHHDRTGFIAEVSSILSRHGINIGSMDVDRKERNGEALTVLELDGGVPDAVLEEISGTAGIWRAVAVDLAAGGSGQ